MAEQTADATIKEIGKFIKPISTQIDEDVLRRCLNETWFSDTLAWLLDPNGGHGFGVEFAKAFVRTVAEKRSDGREIYSHKATHLKSGKAGLGRGASQFKLSNSTTLREFYLGRLKNDKGKNKKDQLYCDIVFIDLDSSESIFIAIENKLFSINTKTQLSKYHKKTEEKFNRAKTREYVYLTLHGDSPMQYDQGEDLIKEWVCLSWISDIKEILEKLIDKKEDCHEKVKEFNELLQYLQDITENPPAESPKLRDILLHIASDCLLEELKRLATDEDKWKRPDDDYKTIYHTSSSAKKLKIERLPKNTVTVQRINGGKPTFDKILIPFGAHPDQIFHLLDMAARYIYHHYFQDFRLYLNDKKKLTKTMTETKKKHKEILQFIHDNRYHLQVLLQNDPEDQKEAESLENENDADMEA